MEAARIQDEWPEVERRLPGRVRPADDDGMQAGHVLQLRTGGLRIKDKTDEQRAEIRLPSEDNGLAMVFLTFERVSYALILQAQRGVVVGDRLVNPE